MTREQSGSEPRDEAAPTRVALVTGGNRGIGFETCRQLAQRGLEVLLSARSRVAGESAAAVLREQGLEVRVVQLDVNDPASIEAVHREVLREYGRLDVLVNNAAISLDEDVSVFAVPESDFEQTLLTNLWGPFRLCRTFVPLMMEKRYGRVVNVSSGSGSLNTMTGTTVAYRVSKAALNALTRVVAAEAYAAGVKVNAVCPGWVRTDMGGELAARTPEQAAETVVWLATLGPRGPTAGFFRDRKPIPW